LKLFEYESKNALRRHGIQTPRGEIATTAEQAAKTAEKLKPPFVIKSQILVGGRGKAGGIRFALTLEDVEKTADELLRSQIEGFKIEKVLVEEKIRAKRELYFAVTLERSQRTYVLVASSKGGIDIETVAAETPTSVVRTLVDPISGLGLSTAERVAAKIGFGGKQQTDLGRIMKTLCQIGLNLDAILLEVNPLAETSEGSFVALDSRVIVDDNALFRHPDLVQLRFEKDRDYTEREIEAMKNGIAYVALDGEIGIVGNGAGLVMATLDLVHAYGKRAANFLDLGGGATTDKIALAVKMLMSDPAVEVILVNIMGGLTRCDDAARAIVEARSVSEEVKPIFARLVGTNEAEGKQILMQAGLPVFESMEEAAKQAVATIKRKRR
jgi:succinyl-CoA synthetase beta subunit